MGNYVADRIVWEGMGGTAEVHQHMALLIDGKRDRADGDTGNGRAGQRQ